MDPRLRSYGELALVEAETKLAPATVDDFRKQLNACLILVAPTGMTQDDRAEWLRAAWGTLDGIPADLLEAGAEVARETCDHPSKIVPTIMRTIDAVWRKRKEDRARVVKALDRMVEPEPTPQEDLCTPEKAREIMERFGIKPEQPKADHGHRGKTPIAPDRDWYIAHGIDPDALSEVV